MSRAIRRIFFVLLVVLLAAAVVGRLVVASYARPPSTRRTKTVFGERFHRYDGIIEEVARRHEVDPMIIKAVVWRESRFRPEKVGGEGERGLMQITEAAAHEWTKGEKITDFVPKDLFDPKTNIEAGTWLIAPRPASLRRQGRPTAVRARGVQRRSQPRRPLDGANAATATNPASRRRGVTSQELEAKINIADTRSYIRTVQNRVQFYHQRGRL